MLQHLEQGLRVRSDVVHSFAGLVRLCLHSPAMPNALVVLGRFETPVLLLGERLEVRGHEHLRQGVRSFNNLVSLFRLHSLPMARSLFDLILKSAARF